MREEIGDGWDLDCRKGPDHRGPCRVFGIFSKLHWVALEKN